MRQGDWSQTYTGKRFYHLDPKPEDISIADIAHSLAYQCRYTGHTTRFYSVAEHSLYVSRYCTPENALWGLLHDASKAYICDIPAPLKPYLTNYKEIEDKIMACICERFGLEPEMPTEVKQLDKDILRNEYHAVMVMHESNWGAKYNGIYRLNIPEHSPPGIEFSFLRKFRSLYSGK